MRCNRKTACFAVTPRKKVVKSLNITDISQLRRNLVQRWFNVRGTLKVP